MKDGKQTKEILWCDVYRDKWKSEKKTGKLEPADSAKMAGDLSVGHLSVELGD